MSFFNELKRRNVFRVGAAYLVVAWLLLQIMDTVGPIIGLSDAFARGVLFLLAIGFPIALVISWVYEMTPDGVATQEAVDGGVKSTSGRKMNVVIIGGLVLVIVLLVVDNYVLNAPDVTERTPAVAADPEPFQGEITQTAGLERSIAVLPLDNQSNDPDQEYFSDGLTDELINRLSQVGDLLVTGRNSSFFFKDRNEALGEIGDLLDVSYILQGSVRRSGDQLRITAQLMEAQSGFNVWSRTFDRQLEDVFAIQDEIAQQVTTNLSVSLGVGEFDRPGMTRDIAAYDAYLRGMQVINEVGLEPEEAIVHLREAVTIDPEFALGWTTLADLYRLDAENSPVSELNEILGLMEEAREMANSIDSDIPEVLVHEAIALMSEGDWLGADRLLVGLLDGGLSNNANVNREYGFLLNLAGKSTEAIPYLQRAHRLDPLHAFTLQALGMAYLAQGREAEAIDMVDKGLSLNVAATFQFLHAVKTVAAYAADDLDRALDMYRLNSPGQPEYDVAMPLLEQWLAGETEAVKGQLREMSESNISPILRAILQPLATISGDKEIALAFMTLPNQGTGQIGFWQTFSRPWFNEPEMKQRFRERGLVDYWQATGWNDFCQPIPDTDNDFECH